MSFDRVARCKHNTVTGCPAAESTLIVGHERSALVLSAGGMFGAYQAGVWERLAGIFDPDVVVGASVGALNGWLIACRSSPVELSDRWLHLNELATVKWRVPSRIADGFIDSSALEAWVRSECASGTIRREFGVVLTHCRTLKPVLFSGAAVNWQHIATSCAVPLFLRHHAIDGEPFTDGGLVDPLPLQAAIDLGATRIVAVNLLKHRPWFIRCAVRGIRAWSGYRPPQYKGIEIVEITPSGRLGTARDSMYWSREHASLWIDRGREDADTAAAQVVEWLNWAEGQGRNRDDGGLSHLSPERECAPVVPLGSAHRGIDSGEDEGLRARPPG